jgi:DDE superfamily endonuclease
MILDNYATHKHQDVKAWLVKHPRFQLHNTATSSSWLNLVERWFRELTGKALRRGVFHSVPDLISSIEEYMKVHNNEPKPLVWTPPQNPSSPKSAAAESPSTKQSVNDETQH